MTAAPLIELRAASIRLGGRAILENVDLAVHPGEIVSLIGPNGAGKSTLLKALLGVVALDTGTMRKRRGLRVGYMPQRLHVDATLPVTVDRFLDLPQRQPAAARTAALADVGVGGLGRASLQELSGGEFQRVLLARLLLRAPELVVLDEPGQGVDYLGQADFFRLIERIRRERGCSILLVSHDLHLVMAATDRVVCLNRHVCCTGRPEAVSQHPAYRALFGPAVADALGVYRHHHDHAHTLSGEPSQAA
jgi:zinc transport system ATP-binding protein